MKVRHTIGWIFAVAMVLGAMGFARAESELDFTLIAAGGDVGG